MKKTSLFLAALFALVSFTASNAQAAEVNFITDEETNIAMGDIAVGQYGIIDTLKLDDTYDDMARGRLSGYSFIKFFYTLSEPYEASVFPVFNDIIPSNTPAGNYKITSDEYLNGAGNQVFTVTLANLINKTLQFSSYISLPGYSGDVLTTYTTVPLPAALPLFGLGLVGLAGIKRMRKNKASA